MKNRFRTKFLRLVFFPVMIALIALLGARAANSQKSACALEGKPEKAALSSPESSQESATAPSESRTEDSNNGTSAESNQATLPYIEPQSSVSTTQDAQSYTVNNDDADHNTDSALSDQQDPIQEVSPSPVEEPQAIPPQPQYKSAELLVKFKAGVNKDRIDSINSANHTTTLEVIEQIDTYILAIDNGSPAQEVVDIYNSLPEVEYAELNSVYDIPETGMNVQPIG